MGKLIKIWLVTFTLLGTIFLAVPAVLHGGTSDNFLTIFLAGIFASFCIAILLGYVAIVLIGLMENVYYFFKSLLHKGTSQNPNSTTPVPRRSSGARHLPPTGRCSTVGSLPSRSS